MLRINLVLRTFWIIRVQFKINLAGMVDKQIPGASATIVACFNVAAVTVPHQRLWPQHNVVWREQFQMPQNADRNNDKSRPIWHFVSTETYELIKDTRYSLHGFLWRNNHDPPEIVPPKQQNCFCERKSKYFQKLLKTDNQLITLI